MFFKKTPSNKLANSNIEEYAIPIILFLFSYLFFNIYPLRWYRLDTVSVAAYIRFAKTFADVPLHFAHPFEYPLVYFAHKFLFPNLEPIKVVLIVQSFFGSLMIAVFYLIIEGLTKDKIGSILASLTFFACFGTWRLSAGGEKRTMMIFSIFLFVYLFMIYKGVISSEVVLLKRKNYYHDIIIGFFLGFAISIHIVNALLILFLIILYFIEILFFKRSLSSLKNLFIILLVGGILSGGLYISVAIFRYNINNFTDFFKWIFQFHGSENGLWYFTKPSNEQNIAENFNFLLKGIFDYLSYSAKYDFWFIILPILLIIFLYLLFLSSKVNKEGIIILSTHMILWFIFFLFYDPGNYENWGPFAGFFIIISVVGFLSTKLSQSIKLLCLIIILTCLIEHNALGIYYYGKPRIEEDFIRFVDNIVKEDEIILLQGTKDEFFIDEEKRFFKYFSQRKVVNIDTLIKYGKDEDSTTNETLASILEKLKNGVGIYVVGKFNREELLGEKVYPKKVAVHPYKELYKLVPQEKE